MYLFWVCNSTICTYQMQNHAQSRTSLRLLVYCLARSVLVLSPYVPQLVSINSHHQLNQSDAVLKKIVTWSHAFFCAWCRVIRCEFLLADSVVLHLPWLVSTITLQCCWVCFCFSFAKCSINCQDTILTFSYN